MSTEEILGLIQGLAGVVKTNQVAQHDACLETSQQIAQLSQAVAELTAKTQSASLSSATPRLPQLSLPEFDKEENLDRFLDQLRAILVSSGIPPNLWLLYLKQQCRKDARSYDLISEHEQHADAPPFDAKHEDHTVWFEKCLETLHRQRGIPKDQRIQQLLSIYYTMKQNPSESVADFAHRFAEHQHALEKLIPGIHRPSAGDDTELIHAFALKLRQDISADILSRDFNFPNLASLVEAAKRYESRHPPPSQPVDVEKWTPVAQFAAPRNRSQKTEEVKLRDSSQDSNAKSGDLKRICWLFNRYPKANCELPNGQCSNGYVHKCKKCNKLGCKPHFHKRSAQNSQQSSNFSHGRNRPNNPPRSFANTVSVECTDQSTAQHDKGDRDLLVAIHETMQTIAKGLKVAEQPPAPAQSSQSQSQDQLFGMPAITSMPANLNVLGLDLAKKNILWTKITSAGVSLPLPLDSCCSVSLVSQKHAEKVAKSRPELVFTKLEQPVKVSVASPSTSLHAVGTMQVPITWANGRSSTFVMLVVPGLAWPILFGQNHLEATDACVRFSKRRVYFAHQDMRFEVPSTNSNPLAEFPQLGSPPNSAASSAHVTCLVTTRPSPTAGEQLTLGKGFTLIPVCLLLAASLVGSSLFSEPLWLEGASLAPGISVLSGPISLSCVSSQLAPGTPVPPAVSSVRPTQAHPGPPVPTLGISLESMQVGDWSSDDANVNLPEPDLLYYSTVLIRSTKAKFVLPLNALLGYIRPMAPADEQSLNSAVSNTAKQLTNEWYSFAVNNTSNVHNEAVLSSPTTNVAMGNFRSELPNEVKFRPKQTAHATQTGLDSSILSDFLEPAVYAHNTSPISGTSDITPFFLVFGRDAPSPETISLNLPATALPADHYAAHLVSRVKDAHTHFRAIKADLRRRQRELYDTVSRDIDVPEGKTVYLRKDNAPNQAGLASRFLCSFDGPYIVTGHPHGRKDLLTLRHAKTGEPHPRQVNIEKIVVVPDPEADDLRPLEEALVEPDLLEVEQAPRNANSDLANVAFEFGKYLESLPSKSAISSQACKHVYANYPSAREILARHGKLRGLVKSCPYLQLDGGLHGGTYTMSLNLQVFNKLR